MRKTQDDKVITFGQGAWAQMRWLYRKHGQRLAESEDCDRMH